MGLAAAACSREAPPHLLLISLDTTRSDHLSAYGYPRDTTPQLRRFAAGGVRVGRAYAPSSTTAPSHASLFTGLYPIAHRVVKNGLVLEARHRTLAQVLSRRGYQTAAVVASFPLHSRFGFDRGFEHYDDAFEAGEGKAPPADRWEGLKPPGAFDRRADHTTRRALRWLSRQRDPARPFFLFVHYFEPHAPYLPPEAIARRFAPEAADSTGRSRSIARYDAEIAYTDQELGALFEVLDGLGLAETTLVAVVGDHGEGLYDHGHMEHGVHIYEEAVRVPLLLRWPGRLPEGLALPGPVELVDLAPTLLDLMGVARTGKDAAGNGLPGGSFAGALRGEETLDPGREIFLHRRPYDGRQQFAGIRPRGELFGVRAGRWKYIEGEAEATRELFDLDADPGETRNLARAHPAEAARLARRLRDWRRDHEVADPEPRRVRPEDREGLRALGYVD